MRSKILFACVFAFVMLISACGGGKVKPATETSQKNPVSVQKAGAFSEAEKVEFQQALESIKTDNLPNAEKILKKLSDKLGASTSISANLALTYYKLQRYELAEEHINRAIAVNEADAETHNIAGLIAIEMKKHQAAETHYKRALALNPEFANAHYNIALLYDIYFQDIPNAYKHYQQYLSLVGDSDKETKEWVDQLQYSLKQ